MHHATLISVVMPAWNEEKYIGPTLESLFVAVRALEGAGGRAEVIVVDNASTDGTPEIAGAFPVRIVREEVRRISTVRNRGVRESAGEYLAFLDADSHPSPNALVRIRETLRGGRFVGGGVKILPDRWTPFAAVAYGPLSLSKYIIGVSAGMIFTTRAVFDVLGGFDERLYAAEDLEFAKALRARAAKTGKKFANLSDVYVTTSTRKLYKSRVRDMLAVPGYLLKKGIVRRRENCRLWYDENYR